MRVSNIGDICSIEPEYPQIDALNTNKFQEDISQHIDGCKKVMVDLSGVRFIDSSGLGIILGLYRDLMQRSGHIVLWGMNTAVSTLFDMVKLNEMVPCFEKREEAEAYLRGI